MTNSAFPMRFGLSAGARFWRVAMAALGGIDFDLRGGAGQLDTSTQHETRSAAPTPDTRGGLVSRLSGRRRPTRRYRPMVADGSAFPSRSLARHNALPPDVTLREGEIIALPCGSRTGSDIRPPAVSMSPHSPATPSTAPKAAQAYRQASADPPPRRSRRNGLFYCTVLQRSCR